jgi:eukaryotic-like serine/threonine-protein kinase
MSTDDRDALADTAADPTSGPETVRVPRASGARLAAYELHDVIGRGGMGEIVAAHDHKIDREVAIKRLRDAKPDDGAIARFVREAKIQARLDHPAIVPVHELGEDEAGLPYFTMKRLAGTTLAAKLAERGPMQPLLRAFVDVCFAIELAHERGVVHRDLKPSNIMLGNYGDVYVLDWGVARLTGDVHDTSLAVPADSLPPSDTATGAMLGTPGYMAPEQMRGDDVGPPADVYALGAILFEILAGEPFHPPGHGAFASTLSSPPRSPALRRPERPIAPELDATCADALADDPAARPTARALAERIQRYLDGDRDLEHRRRLAAEHVAAARAALAGGHRSDAIYRAGRALALEPESEEAATLVTSLIVTPPDPLPPEALSSLADERRRLDMASARRGAFAYFSVWSLLPLAAMIEVNSWTNLVLLLTVASALGGLAWFNSRSSVVPLWVILAGNLVLVTVFSRLAGPLMLTPLLASGIMLALGSHRSSRTWLALTWLGVAILLPFVFEAVGVLTSTWEVSDAGILEHGTIFHGRGASNVSAVIFGTFALAFVTGAYALSITRARWVAQRATHIQAWHLRQLLPRDRAS